MPMRKQASLRESAAGEGAQSPTYQRASIYSCVSIRCPFVGGLRPAGLAVRVRVERVEAHDDRGLVSLRVAGFLLANLTEFVTPEFMHWFRSGEIMVMVLVGGMGTLFGPLFGAAAFLLFEEVISGWTEHWMVIFGPLLVVLVLFAKKGLWGFLPGSDQNDG